ncbi:MAG: NADH-quinone oxidoreductase subunit K [Actinomycetota bacterium]
MSAAMLLAIGGLVGVGMYLATGRSLSRIVLGFSMLGHAAVLGLLASGGRAGQPPLANELTDAPANPLPQALSLTAIVISFGLTLFLLALARRQDQLTGDDLVEDDLEDRRVGDEADEQPEAKASLDDVDAAEPVFDYDDQHDDADATAPVAGHDDPQSDVDAPAPASADGDQPATDETNAGPARKRARKQVAR